jgi:hypothetical protein
MVKLVCIIPQFIHADNRIRFAAHNYPHIPLVGLCGPEESGPIQKRGRNARVNEKHRPQNHFGIIYGFPYLVGWLKVYPVDGVICIGLVLVSVYARTNANERA